MPIVRSYADDDRQAKRLTVTAPPPFYESPLLLPLLTVVCRRGKRAWSRARAKERTRRRGYRGVNCLTVVPSRPLRRGRCPEILRSLGRRVAASTSRCAATRDLRARPRSSETTFRGEARVPAESPRTRTRGWNRGQSRSSRSSSSRSAEKKRRLRLRVVSVSVSKVRALKRRATPSRYAS